MGPNNQSEIFLRDVRAYRESLVLGMEFLAGAVVDDPSDPDDHSILHMYHIELGGWNRPYTELAGQAIREAFLPYAEMTGEKRWGDLARTVLVDGVLAHAACTDPDSPAFGLLSNCADPLCDYGSPLTGEQMVHYRLDRQAYLAEHPDCSPIARRLYTFDSAEILMAAILLNARRPEPRLLDFINRSWQCFLRIADEQGRVPHYYDDVNDEWGPFEPTTTSRLLWACGLMHQAGMSQPEDALADRLAAALLAHQRPNGVIAPEGKTTLIAEFVIYCIEGLYWGGMLLDRPALVDAAHRSFDAILKVPHVMAGSPYYVYDLDWQPVAPPTAGGPAGVTREIHHMSVVGQMAQLAFRFWQRTGQKRYLETYRYAVDLLFCFQDRRASWPARGGIPRSANMPWWRSICPVYTYASALMLGLRETQ